MEPIETPKLLEQLFDKKKLKIIKLFIAEKNKEFSLSEVAKKTEVPVASTFRIINQLAALGLLEQSQIKHLKLYMLAENKAVRYLESFLKEEKQILELAVDKLKTALGVEQIILHGKATKDWANLFIIGTDLDNNLVKPICAEIKEKYKFTISTLLITQDQYKQMTTMGLYSGEKKTLYKKPGQKQKQEME